MIISKLLTMTGLFFDIIGVILLSYDLFWSKGNQFQTQVLKTQLINEVKLHQQILTNYKNLSQSIGEYRADPHINRENERHANEKDRLEKSLHEISSDYPNRVSLWGIRGLALVLAGFLFQLFGTALG